MFSIFFYNCVFKKHPKRSEFSFVLSDTPTHIPTHRQKHKNETIIIYIYIYIYTYSYKDILCNLAPILYKYGNM